MNFSSSPPVLYLGDDDDDDNNDHDQHLYAQTPMSIPRASSSTDVNLSQQKRKLTNINVHVNPSMTNGSKRQRNDHYQQQLSHHGVDSDLDGEPIFLDPNEYIIEEPNNYSYRSFDWTIQSESLQPQQPPPRFISNKRPSNPVQTATRISNGNNIVRHVSDKSDRTLITNANDKFIQQPRKSNGIPPARPSLALLSLPLPKPTLTLPRSNAQRGRPVKVSRVSNVQTTPPASPIRQRAEPQIFAQKLQSTRPAPTIQPLTSSVPKVTPSSSINNATLEIRRQLLNGTGLFSAFHDSKYYRCNLCQFKSVTSSPILQHLFTHMFFCDRCSYYTYSYYSLSQHIFEKHNLNIIEEIHEPLNPKSFDLLYVTRCSDGTFALCMDSSSSSTTTTVTTNKVINNDQQVVLTATHNTQHPTKTSKEKILKPKVPLNQEDNDIVVLSEKPDIRPRSLSTHTKPKEKQIQTYVLMKHRRFYSLKKPPCLHPLTLEYSICREQTIRHICHTQDILKRRKISTKIHPKRLIEEVAHCLKTIVNTIVDNEENSDQSSLVQPLPNEILNSVLSTDNLYMLTNLLKLNNKYDQRFEQQQLYDKEYLVRQSNEHIFVLSSPETNQTEQTILSSLHSSMTNGDSIFTQTKVDKISTTYDNTNRFSKANLTPQPPKAQKKVTTIPSPPKLIPLRPIVSKPPRPLPNSSVDRNNNPITSSKSAAPSVIILD